MKFVLFICSFGLVHPFAGNNDYYMTFENYARLFFLRYISETENSFLNDWFVHIQTVWVHPRFLGGLVLLDL